MSHLVLPLSRSTASPGPSTPSAHHPSPKRPNAKQRRKLDRVLLDEDDDVDENDLVALPQSRRRRIDEDYDDDEDEGEGDAEVEGEGEGEGDEGEGDDDPVVIRANTANTLRGDNKSLRSKVDKREEIERKGQKRREETFLLREQLDPDQTKRFDTFSTVAINKNAVKRLNRDLYDQHCPPQMCMVVAGMAKIFIADVIELAKDLQPHSAHPTGPLQPYHLKLARLQLEEAGRRGSGLSTGLKVKKGLFRRR
ncbi:hypothetical protein CI109_102498 [Kwoniella shandongensis]|uniref:Uncharacterized protein n=1 Tax=Kwoniella shandongensis TaxID=1734106 RepID=A0A5M6BZJ3_9TREE|nr:uncharacterized protein CI109_003184 [Kwoniella shandongensis]KAA5528286.1 hypothetical protein CI109_003184 [Kwoniella shandongensis]